MKKVILCTAFLLLVTTAIAQSWNEKPTRRSWYKNEFFLAPGYFFDGTFAIGYQYNAQLFSFSLMPSFTLSQSSLGSEREGWGVEAIGKVLFSKMPKKAQIYAGPYVGYRFLNETGSYYDESLPIEGETSYSIVNAGVLFGMHFMWGRFTMDFNFGGGVRYPTVSGFCSRQGNVPNDFGEIGYKGMVPKGNLTFGVAF